MQTDVVIIGAGPTGLALSCQLVRYGIDHVILDEKDGTTPYSKAIGVQARTLEIYDQIGIASQLIEKGWKADKVKMVSGGKIQGSLDLRGIGNGLSPFPFLLILEQGIHETILYDQLTRSGQKVLWNTQMKNFSESEGGVTVFAESPGGDVVIEAKYLVGCDGAHSPVRHLLQIDFAGSTFERLFYVADVDIDWTYDHDALHVNLGDDTLTAFFPMVGSDRWRIVGTFPEGHDKDEGEILYEEIEEQVRRDTDLDFDIQKVNWFSVYKVHSRAASRFSKGRCFIAGDSAHIHTPAGAQGMNTGIQDGYNLAWKLAAVIKGSARGELLETYNEERLPNAKRLLSTTDRIFDFAASDEWFISFVRKNIFPYFAGYALSFDAVKRLVFPIVSQIGINYGESSLSKKEGGFDVDAGERMPWFELNGRSIYEDLKAPCFHFLTFSETEKGVMLPGDLIDKWSDISDSCVYPLTENVRKIFGTDGDFFVLLRPDNYIGLISNDLSENTLRHYLEHF